MNKPSMVTGCKKGKDMNFLEQNIEDYTSSEKNTKDTDIVFECDDTEVSISSDRLLRFAALSII